MEFVLSEQLLYLQELSYVVESEVVLNSMNPKQQSQELSTLGFRITSDALSLLDPVTFDGCKSFLKYCVFELGILQ